MHRLIVVSFRIAAIARWRGRRCRRRVGVVGGRASEVISPRALVGRKAGDMQIVRNLKENVPLWAEVDPTVES